MKALILVEAEADIESAFTYYDDRKPGLGVEFVHEFRRALNQVIEHPNPWQPLDPVYRRYRLHRFPYGIIDRVDQTAGVVLVTAIAHSSREPGAWRNRE